jgi:hypothetical protein
MSDPDWMGQLVGHTITAIKVNPERDRLLLMTDSQFNVELLVDGDCCSRSYFNDINGVDEILGKEVDKVTPTFEGDRDVERDGRLKEDPDIAKYYGIKIESKTGRCDIVFRNESNGYYGGDCGSVSQLSDFSAWDDVTKDGDL